MADLVHDDVAEQILIRLDVKDLIRCKSVCKSWHSLITSSRFVNRHLKHNCNKDRCNIELGHRRILFVQHKQYDDHIVGSSNGLVCIIFSISGSKVLVLSNPLTREVRKLKLPSFSLISSSSCWGFGYDSSRDDYKVIMATCIGYNRTCVQVLSLKLNVWKVIGDVKYRFIRAVGVLCNGALHWIVSDDEKRKNLIIAFDLSIEEFQEIPQPDDASFECSYLGVIQNCLCVYRDQCSCLERWLMKDYNVKQSWDMQRHEIKYDIVNYLRAPNRSFFNRDESWISSSGKLRWDYVHALVFVESLVSPHLNEGQTITV